MKRSTKSFLFLATVATAVVVWLLTLDEEPAHRPSTLAAAGTDEEVRTAQVPQRAVLEPPTEQVESQRHQSPTLHTAHRGDQKSAAISGTLVILEPDGTRTLDANGVIEFSWPRKNNRARNLRVPIQNGAWQLELMLDYRSFDEVLTSGPHSTPILSAPRHVGTRWLVAGFYSEEGEDPAERVDPHQVVEIPSDDNVIEVRRVPPLELVVVDAIDGFPLGAVNVEQNAAHWPIPGTKRRPRFPHQLVRGEASPVTIPALRDGQNLGLAECLVSCAGYVPESFKLDFRQGGRNVIALYPEAKLVVRFSGSERPWTVSVSTMLFESPPELERPADVLLPSDVCGSRIQPVRPEEQQVRFSGLPPGKFTIRAAVKQLADGETILAEQVVALSCGEQTEIEMVLDIPSDLLLCFPMIRVAVPADYAGQWSNLEFGSLDEDGEFVHHWSNIRVKNPDAPARQTNSWLNPGHCRPGRYAVRIPELGFQRELDLGQEGDTFQYVDVPRPTNVHVKVVDGASNTPLSIDLLSWSCLAAREQLEFDEPLRTSPSLLVPKVPLGFVRFEAAAEGYEITPVETHTGTGNEIILVGTRTDD